MLGFIYISVSCQTLTGEGNFAPQYWVVEWLMSFRFFIGMMYSFFVVSVCLSRWDEATSRQLEMETTTGGNHEAKTPSCWKRFIRNKYIQRTRRWTRRRMFAITFGLQVFKLLMLYFVGWRPYK